jgi:hypothetical protein
MKNIFRLLTGWVLLSAHSCPAQLVTMQGSFIRSDTTSFVVLNDLGLENRATVAQFDNVFKFTGGTNIKLSGSNGISFSKIILEKKDNGKLLLDQDIDIKQSILFSGGLIDLNNRILNLQPGGLLLNENKSSRITGTHGGFVSIHMDKVPSPAVDPGNLGAIITSAGNIGPVTIKRGHKMQSGFSMEQSIQRYYDIEFANNELDQVGIRFEYFDAELNGQHENNIKIYESDDYGIHWNMQANAIRNAVPDFGAKGKANYRWTLATPEQLKIESSSSAGILRTWPNPAGNYFYVQAPESDGDGQVQVFDVAGKLYRSFIVKQGGVIKIEGLLPGIYIIKAEGKNFSKSNRVIVQDKNTNQIPNLLKVPSKNM